MPKKDTPAKILLESIRIHNGTASLLPFHQQRVNLARKLLYPRQSSLSLARIIEGISLPAQGTHKLRIEYGSKLIKYDIIPYEIRPVNSLKIVTADKLVYRHKLADRTAIQQLFLQKGKYDDILMVQHGYLTDTSYANVALFDGSRWHTPSWPLLRGTRRQALIENGTLRPSLIRERDLPNFEKVRLINAMLPWGSGPEILQQNLHR